jgi:DeoR family glycerol-3-phosphate regulon repressor
VTIAGGPLRPTDLDVVGSGAVSCFSAFKTDFAVFGVGGIDRDGTLLDFDVAEVATRQAMADNCRTSLLVADASKFGRPAIARGGRLGDADHLFIDGPVPTDYLGALNADRPRVQVAASAETPARQTGETCS